MLCRLSSSQFFRAIVSVVVVAAAKADNVYDWEPSVSLLADLDEPAGWCLDIFGFTRGPTALNCNIIQMHTCKEQGADTQFEYDSDMEALRAVNFDGVVNFDGSCGPATDPAERGCIEVNGPIEAGATLRLAVCDGSPEQTFKVDEDDDDKLLIVIEAEDEDLCLVAGAQSEVAGPFQARDLFLADCETTQADLKSWSIAPFGSSSRRNK